MYPFQASVLRFEEDSVLYVNCVSECPHYSTVSFVIIHEPCIYPNKFWNRRRSLNYKNTTLMLTPLPR